ncbi:PD40 domain-containing protein [Corallococcus macrosporus]|uniref:PD40 domain-containing protein n=1 Tax=Corallococcus macrosporus TaxID=35 RepID=A0ABS3DJ53_9BACT|nr:PD40 domain-containing protein [Corallococcus macrosporus]MBN8231349.1 PD40 domain-containing protein [Corallococcus macrosporus]
MTKRAVWGALFGALTMLATGCGDECVDQFDCRDKGTPPAGQSYVCNADNKCELRAIPTEPEEDAGTGGETDAGSDAGTGGGTDAGTDAGTEADAGTDAGTEVDAGTDAGMNVAKGDACTASSDCMAGLRCEAATCQSLLIAVTGNDGGTRALVTAYDVPGMTSLSADGGLSAYPRFGPGGTQVAFVQGDVTGAAGELAVRPVPLTAAEPNVLTTGGTARIRYMEWEPGNLIAWVRGSTGISTIAPTGGTITSITNSGTFPDWAANGTDYAYSAAGTGIYVSTGGAAPAVLAGSPTSGEQPHFNRVTSQLLFLANPEGTTVNFGTEATQVLKLYSLPVTGGGDPKLLAGTSSRPVTGGSVDSYIANPNWSPDGKWVAYVRANYLLIGNAAVLCGNTGAELCGTDRGNDIYVQRVDASGAKDGEPVLFAENATLPSFSPDGRLVAYVLGGQLVVRAIDPATGQPAATAITHPKDTYTVLTSEGDDYRPRWQPRQ